MSTLICKPHVLLPGVQVWEKPRDLRSAAAYYVCSLFGQEITPNTALSTVGAGHVPAVFKMRVRLYAITALIP